MKKDILINLVITIGIAISLFIVNRYFAFYLGIQNLGLMKLFSQMLAYLNLAEIGLSSASAYAFYKPLAEKDYKQVSIVFNTINSLYNKIFIFVFVMGLLLNPIIPFFIKNNIINVKIYLYWSLYVISTALNYLFVKYSILFTADQKFSFVRLVEGGSRIFCQLLQIFIIIEYKSFIGFLSLLILNNIIQFIFYKLHYKKYYNYIIKTKERDNSITKNLKKLFWHKIGGLVIYNTDLILISKFVSLEIVGIYASYQMVVQMIATILNIILNVLKPRIGKFIAENSKDEVFNYFKKLNILFLGIAILFTFSTYRLINKFVILWLGEAFILTNLTVILISINLFVRCFRGILDIFKEGSGFFDDVHLPVAEVTINLVCSLTLVYYIGLNGVILGTITSNIIVILIARPALVFKRCFDKNIGDYIKIYGNYLILVITSLLASNFIINLIKFNENISWINWFIQAVIVGSITTIITFTVFLSNKDFRSILLETKKLILKK